MTKRQRDRERERERERERLRGRVMQPAWSFGWQRRPWGQCQIKKM